MTTRPSKSKVLSVLSLLILLNLTIQVPSKAANLPVVKFTIISERDYQFAETSTFPHSLTKKQINFSKQFKDCALNESSVVLSSGKYIYDGKMKTSPVIKNFEWLLDSNGEYVLNVTIKCIYTSNFALIRSNAYKFWWGDANYVAGTQYAVSNWYSLDQLQRNKMQVTYYQKAQESGGYGTWSPSQITNTTTPSNP